MQSNVNDSQRVVGILGFGYSASYFAKLLLKNGIKVWGTTSSTQKCNIYKDIKLISFDSIEVPSYIKKSTGLLVSIPPEENQDLVLARYAEQIISTAINISWIGYLSSTSVYGDHGGNWVDESSTCSPTYLRSISRLKIEQQWLEFALEHKLPLTVFRLSSIYGPHRSAIEKVHNRKSVTIARTGHLISRIHVIDIARALYLSFKKPNTNEIYNLSDDHPENTVVIDNYAAELLNVPPLKVINYNSLNSTQTIRGFYQDFKQVSAQKIKTSLGLNLKFPTYKNGLNHCYNEFFEKNSRPY